MTFDIQAASRPRELTGRQAEFDRSLQQEITRLREAGRDPRDPFRGLYITDAEAADLAAEPSVPWPEPVLTRMSHLAASLQLSEVEVASALVALAPEVDPRYERVFAYLQDDVSRRSPSLDLVLRIAATSPEERLELRAALGMGGRFERFGLLAASGDASSERSRLSSSVRLDERIVAYLFGSNEIDRGLEGILPRTEAGSDVPLVTAVIRDIEAVAASWLADRGRFIVAFDGAVGSGKRTSARRLATAVGRTMLEVDTPAFVLSAAPPAATLARLLFREASLHDAALYFSAAPALFEDAEAPRRAMAAVLAQMSAFGTLVMLGGPKRWEPPAVLGPGPVLRVSLPVPTPAERRALWHLALPDADERLRDAVPVIASGFKLTPGQIRDAASIARTRAISRSGAGGSPDVRDLYAATRAVSSRALAAVADEIPAAGRWEDIVLPPDVLAQLRELCTTVRGRGTVMDEWGFGRKMVSATGTTALLAGPSGTGKTMAARIIAAELELPMFRVDLARVVSKWIGETEKNLDRVFVSAEDSNAILFLDEADALFGKRSEVRDSHDRYANLEISYLLQRMELYDGVAILATNMPHLIDDAFTRRLTFAVYFPMPGEAERRRIWQTTWPLEAPRADDVDLDRLAKLKLTGGNIRNVLLAAASLAAPEARAINAGHLRHALRREYQKLGKDVDPAKLEV
jgi:MoxR-like ATPase